MTPEKRCRPPVAIHALAQPRAKAVDLDGVEPHQADVAQRAGELARVIELRAAVAGMEALVSSSSRTGTRGSTWNILRNSFSSRMYARQLTARRSSP